MACNKTTCTANSFGNGCGCSNNNEVLVNNILFNYTIQEATENSYDLVVTPCNVPTSVFCIARISKRQNCCNNLDYYQAFINTDPVEIIQDCSLDNIVSRSIMTYFQNTASSLTAGNNCGCGSFGLF